MSEKRYADYKLQFAIRDGNVRGIEEVLENYDINLEKLSKAHWTEFSKRDRTALGYALSEHENIKIIQMLIENGAKLNDNTSEEHSYLTYAMGNDDYELAKLLLESGADACWKDKDGKSVLDILMSSPSDEMSEVDGKGKWEMAELLIEHGANVTSETLRCCLEAEDYVCGERIIRFLREKKEKSGVEKDLEYAITGESEKLVEYLKKNKVSDGVLVLRYAAANCTTDVLKILKGKGCNFNVEDSNAQTILHIAAKYNKNNVLGFLLDECEKANGKTDFFEVDPLTMAVIAANEENVDVLRKAGFLWQQDGAYGGDAWIAACRAGNEDSVNLLLKKGFLPTAEEIVLGYDCCNESTLQALLKNDISYETSYEEVEGEAITGLEMLALNNPEVVTELPLEKVNENLLDVVMPGLLESAIDSYDEKLACKVIEKVDDLDVVYSASPLEMAVMTGQLEVVKYLVENGADINYIIEEEDGEMYYTALHVAAYNTSCEILKYLLENGGDTNIKDSKGQTPYERAKEAKFQDNMELLE